MVKYSHKSLKEETVTLSQDLNKDVVGSFMAGSVFTLNVFNIVNVR